MSAEYTCDICGKRATYSQITETTLCEHHRNQEELWGLEYEYNETDRWLETVYLKKQRDRKARIDELKKMIAEAVE